MRRLLSAVALAAVAACASPDGTPPPAPGAARPGIPPPPAAPARPAAAPADIGRSIEEYFAKSLSPDIDLEARNIGESDVPGWLQGTLAVNAGGSAQEIGFLVTPDGRYFISGEITDLTIDPLQAVSERIDLEGLPGRGPVDAAVTIVEYSDFQCPFCARGYRILEEEVLPAYEGKVRFYFKHLPLKSIHPWAEAAALATECAREQSEEGYWALYHAMFTHQQTLDEDNLRKAVRDYATEAGLDGEALTTCMEAENGLARIESDIEEATEVGANSTPTFFINGRRLEGAQPLENFKAIIDAELAQIEPESAGSPDPVPGNAEAG